MNATYSTYPVPGFPGAYGYEVTSDAGHAERQDFAPGMPGRVPMSQAEAEAHAQALVAAITAPAQPEATEPM